MLVAATAVAAIISPVVATAVAGPLDDRPATTASTDPRWVRADARWTAAAAERDPREAAAAWQAVAEAFDEVVAATSLPRDVRVESAAAALAATYRALRVDPEVRRGSKAVDVDPLAPPTPTPIDADARRIIDRTGAFLALVPDERGERVAFARFLRARLYWRHLHLDEAVVDFAAILERDREAEVALFAANMLLDSLIRLERYDEMIAWVRRLRGDAAFLARDEEMAERLRSLEIQWQRKQAERWEKQARAGGSLADYDACAAAYDQAIALAPEGEGVDELLFDAGVCLENGRAHAEALLRYRRLLVEHPRSRLAGRTLLRVAGEHERAAEFAEAAAAYEEYARRFPGEKQARAALADAAWLRLRTGDRAAARRDLARSARAPLAAVVAIDRFVHVTRALPRAAAALAGPRLDRIERLPLPARGVGPTGPEPVSPGSL